MRRGKIRHFCGLDDGVRHGLCFIAATAVWEMSTHFCQKVHEDPSLFHAISVRQDYLCLQTIRL